MHFLFPHSRVKLLLRTMLTREWDETAWPARGVVELTSSPPSPRSTRRSAPQAS
jgi:hypothetical protein